MSSPVDAKIARETEFALKICHALDQITDDLPEAIVVRLARARRAALARRPPEALAAPLPAWRARLATSVGPGMQTRGVRPTGRPLRKLAFLWPLAVLLAGLAGIEYWADQQRLAELADIDAAMLSDNLPPSAYLDHGFHAYLTHAR